jgi:hypothetical protein
MRQPSRLILTAICRSLPPLVALTLWAAPVLGQSLVCHPLRDGESAEQAARRVTGASRNMYSASFQIMNASSRFIPKSQYNRLEAGWRACVVKPSARDRAADARLVGVPSAIKADAPQTADASLALAPTGAAASDPLVRVRVRAQSAVPVSSRPARNVDFTMVWLATAIAVPWFGFQAVDGYLTRRKAASVVVQHFANRFIAEFERPLAQHNDTERPLKALVRATRRGQFDILLAPGPGRRYPNLTDHKKNVEYDVVRVMQALGDDAFVPGALHMRAEWVVVPFQPRTGQKQSSVTCISSF